MLKDCIISDSARATGAPQIACKYHSHNSTTVQSVPQQGKYQQKYCKSTKFGVLLNLAF